MMTTASPLLPQWRMRLEVEEVVEGDDENQPNANVADTYVPNDSFVDDGIRLLILSDLSQRYDPIQVEFHGEFRCRRKTKWSYSFVGHRIEQGSYALANRKGD